MDDLDDRLLAGGPLDPQGWARVAQHVSARLEQYLGAPLDAGPLDLDAGPGFSIDIAFADRASSPLAVHWRGILGADVYDGGKIWVSAILFPTIARVPVRGRAGGDFIDLIYRAAAGNGGHWSSRGWQTDDYGEYGRLLSADEGAGGTAG